MKQQQVRSDLQSKALGDALAGVLIRHAARNAPGPLSDRLQEEWLADLRERTSTTSRLRFALGCCWATVAIRREHDPVGVPVTGTANARTFIGLHHPRAAVSRRTATLFVVVGLHAGIFYAVIVTTHPLHRWAAPPIQLQTIERSPPPKVMPTLPQPDVKLPRLLDELVPRIPEAAADPRQPSNLIGPEPRTPSEAGPPQQPPHEVMKVQGGPGAGFPNPDDYYPSAARRLEEQGLTTIRVCVDANGKLSTDPAEVQSSGSSRLDEAALKLAKAGSGHYRPSTEDGHPVSSCYPFRVRFQIRN